MRHTRIVATVTTGQLPPLVQRQLAGLFAKVRDGQQVVIEAYDLPTRRTSAQNDGFHAMIAPWARDEGHAVDELKRDLLGAVFGWQVSPLGTNRVPRQPSTSALSVEAFNELMERTVEIAADCGYQLVLPSEYKAHKFMPESMKR